MAKELLRPVLIIAAMIAFGAIFYYSNQYTEKIILVNLEVTEPRDAERAYLPSFDRKKVTLEVEFEDTLNLLSDFALEEDPIRGPGCFMPELKMIFKDYTYIVSLYCTSVMKYKNKYDFQPSNVREPNDLEITETVLTYLKMMRKKHFGQETNLQLAARFKGTKNLLSEDELIDDDLYDDDDDDDEGDDLLDHPSEQNLIDDINIKELEDDLDDDF